MDKKEPCLTIPISGALQNKIIELHAAVQKEDSSYGKNQLSEVFLLASDELLNRFISDLAIPFYKRESIAEKAGSRREDVLEHLNHSRKLIKIFLNSFVSNLPRQRVAPTVSYFYSLIKSNLQKDESAETHSPAFLLQIKDELYEKCVNFALLEETLAQLSDEEVSLLFQKTLEQILQILLEKPRELLKFNPALDVAAKAGLKGVNKSIREALKIAIELHLNDSRQTLADHLGQFFMYNELPIP
ncbi:hypothetical protein CH373_05195 [Leptospira perolatii]|uniref:Uncharacterized protein n=1 Tax=Leptospira perolatii TaxID=2023191 RepID=A0A2M9ZQK2_9LEPT|nr:hypothetical protein [Leptospira perolatii]PJZ70469.1 hypothetical protein CH360_05615 [Leptospira perolatii]PJZ74305.1 hypothetical protein CH373_05195 [Leptospira perolatii]